jgi:hypothetical protein
VGEVVTIFPAGVIVMIIIANLLVTDHDGMGQNGGMTLVDLLVGRTIIMGEVE